MGRRLPAIRRDLVPCLMLLAAALLALGISQSPLATHFEALQDARVTLGLGPFLLEKTILHWVNDGLMVLFFFVVTLEIKRELACGALSRWDQAALPVIAAIGGMAVPAAIYVAFNMGGGGSLRGWAIPSATDIAFAVGILALLGSRVPIALRIFLLSLAIIDDLGSIIIIALFYTDDLSATALGLAAMGAAALMLMNRRHVVAWAAYLAVGVCMWVCVLKSGVHATLAGVLVGAAIPLNGQSSDDPSPLETMRHTLEPWVNFLILPLFAFLNAGVPLGGLSLQDVLAPIPLGIAVGLFLGKQLGIFGASWIAVRSGIAKLPDNVSWVQLYGAGILAGIGFTMSLFVGSLAFPDDTNAAAIRIGVVVGSVLSGCVGLAWLHRVLQPAPSIVVSRT
jgi:Na+:H+ antiporter, NhaA family